MILLLGFPKCGTSSFQSLFESLGLKSVHHMCYKQKRFVGHIIKQNKDMKRPLLTSLQMYDCITQMDVSHETSRSYWPQLFDFKQLYFENPTATFILNKRSPKRLLRSFRKWKNGDIVRRMYVSGLLKQDDDELFLNFVHDHYKRVEAFFSKLTNAKFMIYSIDSDNVDKLSAFIDLKDVRDFPHKNQYASTT